MSAEVIIICTALTLAGAAAGFAAAHVLARRGRGGVMRNGKKGNACGRPRAFFFAAWLFREPQCPDWTAAEALESTASGGRETTDEVCPLVVRTALPKYRVNDVLRERGEKGADNAHAAERNRDDAECDVQFVVRLLGDALAQDGN